MSTTTTKRITKSQRFTDIQALLTGGEVVYGTTVDEAVKFIDNEKALLAKKNTADKAPTKTQQENMELTEQILNYLMTQTEGVTCSTIKKALPAFADYEVQKVASLMRPLVPEKVKKEMVKGRALFSLA